MLAKMTSKYQLTLPRGITAAVGPAGYFDVQAQGGQITLTPVRIQQAGAVRAKLADRRPPVSAAVALSNSPQVRTIQFRSIASTPWRPIL